MRIEIVQLENIRSHLKSTVPFARGFNCLVGGLGCGKSSVLYAIDFAFFGEPVGRSYEYLLREGSSTGLVTVQFVQNGKSYKIARGLKRQKKGISQDFDELRLFEEGTLVSSVKSEAVAEQLRATTGLEKDLFRQMIWVRQEHLKELIDASPRERQSKLDELFGFSDYETAWANLALYSRDYLQENQLLAKDPDVAGIERIAGQYDRAVEDFSAVEIALEDLDKRVVLAKKRLADADSDLEALEAMRSQTEVYRRREAQLEANLENTRRAITLSQQSVNEKQLMIEKLQRDLFGYQAQAQTSQRSLKEAGIDPDLSLETGRGQLEIYDSQITNLRSQQSMTIKSIKQNEQRTISLSTENRCPLCLQELNEQYREGLLARIRSENENDHKTAADLQGKITELSEIRDRANQAFSELQPLSVRIESSKGRLNEEQEKIAKFQKEIREAKKVEMQTLQELELVKASIAKFDLSKLDQARIRNRQALSDYNNAESQLRETQNRKKEIMKWMDELKERIDQAQHKIERMERATRLVEIVSMVREAYRNIQPRLRTEFVKVLRSFVQQVLDSLVGGEGSMLNIEIDETYTPMVRGEGETEREVANLSGGERTLVAFAYRIGLGQLVLQSRTGHGISTLLLDEPTESLGSEDESIDRLAEAISRLKAVEQIIAVTHSDDFSEKAEHVVRFEKEAGVSTITVER